MPLANLQTRHTVARDLRTLGVRAGSVLLVHASVRHLGWIVGGPEAVVLALLDVLGPDGTLVVPTHTSSNSDPAGWHHPPVPRQWWDSIRRQTPGFDPERTPSYLMGVLAETVRTWPLARRSAHPQTSFAALGRHAELIIDDHPLTCCLGERSPIGRIYELDGDVLLLGVAHESNTSLHLGEYRSRTAPIVDCAASLHRPGAAVTAPGVWTTWRDRDVDASDFPRLGEDLEASGAVRIGTVGAATARLMRQRAAVDFATDWLHTHRRG